MALKSIHAASVRDLVLSVTCQAQHSLSKQCNGTLAGLALFVWVYLGVCRGGGGGCLFCFALFSSRVMSWNGEGKGGGGIGGYLGATRGVTVSMSAFLACHQCCCAGSSLVWGLNLRVVVCGIFLKLVARDFLRVLRFPPLLHRFNGTANKIKLK